MTRSFRVALTTIAITLISTGSSFAKTKDGWVQIWGAAMMKAPPAQIGKLGAEEETLRTFVHLSIGGEELRFVFSNEFGTTPLRIGAVSVANTSSGPAYSLSSPTSVLFHGQPTATIAAGEVLRSDPVRVEVAPLADLAVSLDLPKQVLDGISEHVFAAATNLTAPGKQDSAVSLTSAEAHPSVYFLRGVEVQTGNSKTAAIVTFGDSITDGTKSSVDANRRYPDDLARRLQANPVTRNFAVVNEGIGGNRVLHDGFGPAAVSRFDRDVLAVTGVKYVVLLEGINDITRTHRSEAPEDKVSAQQIIAGYKKLITRAHKAGLKIFGATLTPYAGFKQAVPETLAMVAEVNEFIRHGGQFDGVIDFNAAVRDPAQPEQFLPAYDGGDHLHPSDAGYQAMADGIDLSLFK